MRVTSICEKNLPKCVTHSSIGQTNFMHATVLHLEMTLLSRSVYYSFIASTPEWVLVVNQFSQSGSTFLILWYKLCKNNIIVCTGYKSRHAILPIILLQESHHELPVSGFAALGTFFGELAAYSEENTGTGTMWYIIVDSKCNRFVHIIFMRNQW